MAILVIGATGRIGGDLVKALAVRGEKVRALVRSSEKAATVQGDGVEAVVGDLERHETLEAALQGVDKPFFISGDSNRIAELHGNFVDAAKRAGVGHIVRMSILVAMTGSSTALWAMAKWV